MKRLFVLSILILALRSSAETPDSIPDGGYLMFDEQTVDLGFISGDSIATARFTVRNIGTDTVAITKVFSDCGCTVPSYSRRPLAPGDSSLIEVSYDPRGYRWGKFRRVLRLRSNAVNPLVPMYLKGSIKQKYRRN